MLLDSNSLQDYQFCDNSFLRACDELYLIIMT